MARLHARVTGDFASLNELLSAGVQLKGSCCGYTSLHVAVSQKELYLINELLPVNAKNSINTMNAWGESPLFTASGNGDVEIVRLLLGAGADVNLVNRKGETALFKPSLYGDYDVVRLLLDAGADPAAADNGGWTVLDCAESGVLSGSGILTFNLLRQVIDQRHDMPKLEIYS